MCPCIFYSYFCKETWLSANRAVFEESGTVSQREQIAHLKPASGENICGLFLPFLREVVILGQ